MKQHAGLLLVLVLAGAGWGLTQPLSKIAVSTGYQPLGLVFWQFIIGISVLGLMNVLRRKPLPLHCNALGWYLFIAVIGTLLPNANSFLAYQHLPAGVMSIVIASVPMFALPIALSLGNDTFSWLRLGGLVSGLVGVFLLSTPEAIPTGKTVFLALALIAPFLYAVEGNIVAKWGAGGLDAVTLLLGASIMGAILALPLAVFSGQWINPLVPWNAPEWALIGASVIHALVYSAYVWLVGRAGATFATQVSYIVTGAGVLWAMLILGESYSGWVWAALGFMFIGLFLVQPRQKSDLPETT